MGKLIILFLTLGLAQSLQSDSLVVKLPESKFNFEQIERDAKLIEEAEAARRKRFRFREIKNEPTLCQLRYSWFINSLDVGSSIYAINNRNNLVESNFILGERPEEWEFIALKSTLLPIAHSNLEAEELTVLNTVLTAIVARNLYLINTHE